LIEFWSHEGSPGARLVRETLNTLELPYLLHNVPHGSKKRQQLRERVGKESIPLVPYLEDPSTGWKGYGVKKINDYLRKEYQIGGIAQAPEENPKKKKDK